jgi:signal transduction histidine kinase
MVTANPPDSAVSRNPSRWLQRLPVAVRVVLLIGIYLISWYVLDVVALQFESAPEIEVWYPPSALDVVLLLVFGLRLWPALLLNSLVHNWLLTDRHLPFATLLIFNVTTTLGYTGACYLLLKKLRINPRLRQLRDVVWFILIAAILAPFCIAVVQFVNFAAIALVPWSDWVILILSYWAGDSTGIGMLAPFLLVLLRKLPWVWASRDRSKWGESGDDEQRCSSRRHLWILVLQIVSLAFGIWLGYGAERGKSLDYTYFVFFPLIWIAVQWGFSKTTVAVLAVNLGVALLASYRTGIARTLVLQFGLMGFTHAGILLGAILTERNSAQKRLRQMNIKVRRLNVTLEQQVQERTAQLQEQMQHLQQLSQVKDDFLSMVSHELRSPMANMAMAIQMLQLETKPERRSQYLRILSDECNRETALINDLLDLQRLEAGADTLELQTVVLEEWLPHIINAFQERTRIRQQTLHFDLAPDLSSLTTDPFKLERIVTELITNACKYTPNEGAITVIVRAKASTSIARLELSVCNTGSEILATELTRIFEKFYRIPKSDRWKQGGTGLGLALVQELVKQLGGEIRVESAAMQTIFTIELPCVFETNLP